MKTYRFTLTFFEWVKQLPATLLPKFFKKRTSAYIREIGLRRIERELDIVYFMRKQFVLNSIIRALTTKV